MSNLTKWFQILVILILFLEITLVGVAEPPGAVLDQKDKEDELHTKKITETVETPKTAEFKEIDILDVKIDNRKQKKTKYVSKERIIPPEQEYSKLATSEYGLENNGHLSRQKHSLLNKIVSASQRKQLCGDFEHQPCTCYYPDHPNVTRFELDTDEITLNAANINGTGPGSCEDLRRIGYKLAGFYMVRFKPKRVKVIYCGFNHTFQNFAIKNQPSNSSFRHGDAGSSQTIQFCNSRSENQPCIFLYPDYPDIQLFNTKTNKTTKNTNVSLENYISGPANCDELKLIGHQFNGFYITRRNALKVKIVYCDFNFFNEKRTKRSALIKNGTASPKNVTRVCKGIGSQPCSCYFSNYSEILQLELSEDEHTSNAIHSDGTGPSSCKELENLGHSLNGFYFLRINTTTIKTAYCKLNETKRKPKKKKKANNELTTMRPEPTSTFLEIETEMPTTIKKNKRPKCGSNLQIFLLKNEDSDNCLIAVNRKSLSMSKCSKSSLEQHWTRSNSLGRSDNAAWEHVCFAYSDQCLTIYKSTIFMIDSVELKPFITHEHAGQKWMIGKTGQLYNMATDFSLAANLKSPWNPKYYTANNWDFEMEHFLKEPSQKWSFIPIKDNNNAILCTKG